MNPSQYIDEVSKLSADASSKFGSSLTIAGDSSIAALATVGNAAQDWSKIASGDPKGIGQIAALAVSVAPQVFQAVASSLGSLGGAISAVADSVPIVGQFFSFAFGLADALNAANRDAEAEDRAKQTAASEWCRLTQWAPQGSGENGRVYPADFFNAPRDLYGKPKKFPPAPAIAVGIEQAGGREMPLIGRTLILALETDPQKIGDVVLGVSSAEKRRWFRRTRKAIQAAPKGSDGGMLLWPQYVDLAMDEFLNGGVSIKGRRVLPEETPWTPELAWRWFIANVNNATANPSIDFIPAACDSRGELATRTWEALSSFLGQWRQTWVTPQFAPAMRARQVLLETTQRRVRSALALKPGTMLRVTSTPRAAQRRRVVVASSALLLTGAAVVLRSAAWRSILLRATRT